MSKEKALQRIDKLIEAVNPKSSEIMVITDRETIDELFEDINSETSKDAISYGVFEFDDQKVRPSGVRRGGVDVYFGTLESFKQKTRNTYTNYKRKEDAQILRNPSIITQDKYKANYSDARYGTTTNYAKEKGVELSFIREIFMEGLRRDTKESPSNFADIRLLSSPFKYWYKLEKVCLFSAWNKEGETPRLFLGRIKKVSEK